MAPQLLAEHVVTTLGSEIVNELKPAGTILRIEDLEERFGVSRTVVREAVKQLESLRLVTSRRRVGIEVAASTEWSLLSPDVIRWRLAGARRVEALTSIGELRRGVEPLAAALAARRATVEQRKLIMTSSIDMAHLGPEGDLMEFMKADVIFHTTILQASQNPMLASLAYIVDEALTGRTKQGLMPDRPKPEAVAWHSAVARAITDADPIAAEQAMRNIVEEAIGGVGEVAELRRKAD